MEKEFTVSNKLGLHARPASLFVQESVKHQCRVQVSKVVDGENVVVNGKSVMGIMMLAAACGDKVKLLLDGEDEAEAMKGFEDLFTRHFDEE